jgi:GDP-mannose 6-dehydrogenase
LIFDHHGARSIFLKIIVLGLGHLGSTVAACAVADGHEVLGVDTDSRRWGQLSTGVSPVIEPGLTELLRIGYADGRLSARGEPGETIKEADIVIICVGTPRSPSGALDLSQVIAATKTAGLLLRSRSTNKSPLSLVYRCTLTPGTMEGLILPLLQEMSGTPPGILYEACYNPESLREGSAVLDYRNPSRIIVGERFRGATRRVGGLYNAVAAPMYELSYAAAELIKLADNSFHALKIAFANELGRYAVSLGIDAQSFADVFVADDKLNTSKAYLKPGGAFGGPCLRKDTQALAYEMAKGGGETPLISSIIPSNMTHHSYLRDAILSLLPQESDVLVFGIGFKVGSVDLRDSPAVDHALELLGAGHRVSIFDPDVSDLEDFRMRLPAELRDCWVTDASTAVHHASFIVLWKPAPNLSTRAKVFDFQRLGDAQQFLRLAAQAPA